MIHIAQQFAAEVTSRRHVAEEFAAACLRVYGLSVMTGDAAEKVIGGGRGHLICCVHCTCT